jgi:8-oxo-dGTP pyrophosphatase MutT (NUDIX family)
VHRQHLNALLRRYAEAWPGEEAIVARFREFAAAHADCLLRTCVPGHITASAWIVSADGTHCLLTHHRKLGRWLQLGGHVDGESRIELAALREAEEESGMAGFSFEGRVGGDPRRRGGRDTALGAEGEAARGLHRDLVPLDLDVHAIPARGSEPRHDHWDVRFLLRAPAGQDLVLSDESTDLRWFPHAEVTAVTDEESVLRLQRKAAAVLAR